LDQVAQDWGQEAPLAQYPLVLVVFVQFHHQPLPLQLVVLHLGHSQLLLEVEATAVSTGIKSGIGVAGIDSSGSSAGCSTISS
jgi:hypothetical protein